MEKDMLQKVAALWKMHWDHQSLYKGVMKNDIPDGVRDLCSKGYLIASVCMNEISVMYDDLKSPFGDEGLPPKTNLGSNLSDLPNDCRGAGLARYLQSRQSDLIKKYLAVLRGFRRDESNLRLLLDHVFVLRRLTGRLRDSGKKEPRAVVRMPGEERWRRR